MKWGQLENHTGTDNPGKAPDVHLARKLAQHRELGLPRQHGNDQDLMHHIFYCRGCSQLVPV